MKVKAHLLVLAATALVFSSCANLFEGNLFENFDGPPDSSEILSKHVDADGNVKNPDKFVRDLRDASGSNRFYTSLKDSERAELSSSLQRVYSDADADPAVRQQASLLAAEISIRGTTAADTINNVSKILTSDAGVDSFNNPRDLLDAVIPDSARNDATAIKKIIDSLVAAGDAYDALGGTLEDADGDGRTDGVAGTNMTSVAQNAAVAIAVKKLVEDPGIGSSENLARLAADPEADLTSTSLDNFPGDTESLDNILDAGGLGGLFEDD